MTLGFSTEINGKPTNFVNKIWAGFFQANLMHAYQETFDNWGLAPGASLSATPKIHTIRRDEKNRWKAGNKIHFVTGNRTKDRFQFAPILMVKSIQKVCILQCGGNPCVYLWAGDEVGFMPFAFRGYNDKGLEALALNDGFESVEAFFDYFNEDFEGKIIHWTDTKYQF